MPTTPHEAVAVAQRLVNYVGNPFADAGRFAAAGEVAEAWAPRASELLAALVRAGDNKLARRAAVALTLHARLAGTAPAIADARQVPAALLDGLKLKREAVLGIAASAARCTRALGELRGVSAAMQSVRVATWKACFGESVYEAIRMQPFIRGLNVLIRGETGTGKELVARAIASSAADPAPTQAVNAAAIPRDLLESELFGHRKGAFSGASSDRDGKLVAASGGTIFLDEVADLAPELQPKLLRVIETHRVTPIGANEPLEVNLRYVSATSEPLESLVESGGFRRDLYQRLAGATIAVPPLRDRPEDLQPIADVIFERFAARMGLVADGSVNGTSTAELSPLHIIRARFHAWLGSDEAAGRPWHGNVRELENVIRAWLLGLGAGDGATGTPAPVNRDAGAAGAPPPALDRFLRAEAPLRDVEDWYVMHVLAAANYSQRKAAKILGIDRGTLSRRLRRIESGEQ